MTRTIFTTAVVLLALAGMLLTGCSSSSTAPVATSTVSSLTTENVVAQDLAQLKASGVTGSTSVGVFSIGWNQFVGPNIVDAGTIGKAFAVVRNDTALATRGGGGIDIGTVTLSYTGGTTELTKQTTPRGEVLYSTFARGLQQPQTVPVNIPFVSSGVYTFGVTGSTGFSAGSFSVTAPASLLDITNHADRDSVSLTNDLTINWTGGSAADSVLVRIVPHLRRQQVGDREARLGFGMGGHDGAHGPMGGGPMGGGPMGGGPMGGGRGPGHGPGQGGPGGPGFGPLPGDSLHAPLAPMGPEFQKGIVKVVANTGSFTLSAADLQSLVAGTEAGEVMVGVTQEIAQDVTHDGKTVTVLLRNGDRMVLLLR